ncbi:hypothetical protein ANTQUA_LOCUS2138 [Anthophora quadrimaculata]
MTSKNLSVTSQKPSTSIDEYPFVFKEENTELLYKNLKMILQDVSKGTSEVCTCLKELETDIVTTAKLLKVIEINSIQNEI